MKAQDLGSNYEDNFLQFHMHWGDSTERGSEHLIDNHAYAAEVFLFSLNYLVNTRLLINYLFNQKIATFCKLEQ